MLSGKTVLVAGGAGSVGRALLPRLLSRDPLVVRVLDNSEPALSGVRGRFDDDRLRYFAGDIRDRTRLDRAIEDVDVVIHLAAMKHVDISEYNPFEAVKTNVLGLQNAIDASIDASVERFLFTSSDKAVDPANTMGTTKLLGEHLVRGGNKYSGRPDISLASVRFGNVINSSHSVVPLFDSQIREGGPVTLTDDRMTRFFLTFEDIAGLVTDALEHMQAGEVFLRRMDGIRIEDLAGAMVDVLAPRYGHDPESVEIELIGRRIGETLHEEVVTEREARRLVANDDLYAIPPETTDGNGYIDHDGLEGFGRPERVVRSSGRTETLDRNEVEEFVERHVVPEVADG